MSVNFLHIRAVGHLVPSVECCHLEELFRSSLGKRRSRTMFLHITLADIMVTLFPIAGQQSPHQGHSTKVDPDSRTQQTAFTSSQTSDQHLPLLDTQTSDLVPGQMVWEIMDRRWTAGWGFCKVSSSISIHLIIIQKISKYLHEYKL